MFLILSIAEEKNYGLMDEIDRLERDMTENEEFVKTKKKLEKFESENAKLLSQVEMLTEQKQNLSNEQSSTQADFNKKVEELAQTKEDYRRVRKEHCDQRARIEFLEGEVSSFKADVVDYKKKMREKEGKLHELQKKYNETAEKLRDTENEIDVTINEKTQRLREKVAELEHDLKEQRNVRKSLLKII